MEWYTCNVYEMFRGGKYKIVVTMQPSYYKEAKRQLEDIGLIEGEDFVEAQKFIPQWYLEKKNKIYLFKMDMPIISSCNFKCKDCIQFSPYSKNGESLFEDIKNSIDILFMKVDYICQFNLLGGEPFLHSQLERIVEYIGNNYSEKIGYLWIITNGSILPSSSLLAILKKYEVSISVSDYSETVPYKDRVDAVCKLFEENGVEVMRNCNIQWYDMGFPKKKFFYSDENVKKHMKNCNTVCQTLYDGKIWYCSVAYAAYKEGLFPEGKNDNLDLKEIDENNIKSKRKILDYCNGDVQNGYLQICRYCGGRGVDNDNKIITAKQMP